MKRDFTHENFEKFLKHNADNLRMKAPDKVWQNLSRELNQRRKRYTTGAVFFLLIASVFGYLAINNSTPVVATATKQVTPAINNAGVANRSAAADVKAQTNSPVLITSPKQAKTTGRSLRNTSSPFITATIQNKPEVATPIALVSTSQSVNATASQLVTQNTFSPTVVDSYTEFDEPAVKEIASALNNLQQNKDVNPLTIESVINAYRLKLRKKKVETQFYFAPTISYRKLAENKSYLRNTHAASASATYTALNSNINTMVTHKPDIGFELGITGKHTISKNVKLRAGFQLNMNRYDVKAFSIPTAMATIALNRGSVVDSLNIPADYSNITGAKPSWLQNFSFQVSAPIGVELILKGNDKMKFGIATTVQPTYVIGDRAYLITSDYKSYTEVPWLVRRWNVNTNFETFVSYQAGKTKWQVGPQVRYQLLSSFINKYPVKENLFDFGLKVGVSVMK